MPRLVKFGREFLLNTATASDQSEPTLTALTDGRFVAAWTDYSSSGDDTSDAAIRAQVFNADGTKSGAEFLVNTTTASLQVRPTLTALADGRFVAAWTDFSASVGDTSSLANRAQMFNADGTKSGTEFVVNTTTFNSQDAPTLTALADGRFVAAWSDESSSNDDTSDAAIRAQVFNVDGTKSGAEFLVNTTTFGNQTQPTLTTLADGRFVAAWADSSLSDDDTSASAIRAQVFNADGTKSGAEFLVNTTTASNQFQPTLTALADGRFVAIWTDNSQSGDDTSFFAIRAQMFNADGTKSGTEFLVNTTTTGVQEQPTLTALADGRFVAVWSDESASSVDLPSSAIRAQVFNADGTKSGTEFLVNTATTGVQEQPTLTALADGRIMIGWTDQSASGGDTSGSAIRGQMFDPREAAIILSGTTLNDQFVGTDFNDKLSGLLGNDRLDGANGADTLAGGGGNDRLRGDAGGDAVSGASGNDTVLGGAGTDRLSGGMGVDRLQGGTGADSLSGGSGADRFVFASAGEARGDRISDFKHGLDNFDLSAFMDGGRFIGSATFKPAGTQAEVRYVKSSGLLQGDVDGNGTVDWSLTIGNKAALTTADFLF